ncbi:MAG: hypothetical protein WBP81_29820 [Solirubrobacteraceae bacterium]
MLDNPTTTSAIAGRTALGSSREGHVAVAGGGRLIRIAPVTLAGN